MARRLAVVVLSLFLATCTGDQVTTPPDPPTLEFFEDPADAVAGDVISPAVEVEVLDADGNRVTDWVGNVTIQLGANPSGGVLSGTTTVAVAGGVASFDDLSIAKAGTGYTLQATATGASAATSALFAIAPGPASELAFTQQPTTATAGVVLSPAVIVTARDEHGNTATDFTDNVTVEITNAGGATLSGTTTLAAIAGVATFSSLSIERTGSGFTLTASSGSLTAATSATITIAAGAATQLVFSVEPGNTGAGTEIAPPVQVSAQDAMGNTNLTFTGNVTVAIGNNPGGGLLSGTTTVAALNGVATFSTLRINQAGVGYTLTASSGSLAAATTAAFDISVGVATQLAFTVHPAVTTTAGQGIAPTVEVTAQDAFGNTDPTFTDAVTVAIGDNPAAGTLSGTVTVAAVAGVATFSDLSIDKAGVGYTLTANSGALTPATSSAFNITPGAATRLAFTVHPPVTITAGQTLTPSLQVSAQDALGNTSPTFSGPVTVAIGANPGAGTLSGIASVAAVGGVATFSTLSIDKAGVGYTLTAGSGALTPDTSTAFTITPGVVTQLVFTVQPNNAVVGVAIMPAIRVSAQDALGNTNPIFTGDVTVAIGNNPGGGTLSGTATVAAVSGVATFSTLSIDRAGVGYTLTANSGSLTAGTSATFTIGSGVATKLVFTVQPVTTIAGQAITPAVQVSAQDALGNTDVSFTGPVTVAIGSNPASGILSGTVTLGAVLGVATFSNLNIDKAGIGYTLTANSGVLTAATSAAFTISAGVATKLTFTVQPVTTIAAQAITPAIQVSAQDALGNTNPTFTGNVTLAIGTNPAAGTLSGTATVAAVAGVATFSTLNIDKAGVGYTLTATSGSLTPATSVAFTISAGAATKLTFTVQPVTTIAGQAITPAVQVSAQDALGNTNLTFTANVTVAIGTNPAAGTLSGTATVAAVAGVATFSTLNIDRAGVGYTLTANSGALTPATSAAFTISAGAATKLTFTVQPVTTIAGQAITPAVRVSAQDALGNTNLTFTGNVTVAIGTNPAAGILSGTATVAAVAGVATFSTLNIDKAGVGYTLTANSGALTAGTSAGFTISAGAATKVVFTVPPSNAPVGMAIAPPVQVSAQDALGNTNLTFTGNVTVAIGTNPSAGILSGTTTQAAVAGVATFSNLSIDKVGVGYTLTANSGVLTAAASAAFTITAGAPSQLVFTVQPATTTVGATISPAIKVTAQDAIGNTVTTFAGNVTVAIGTNPPGTGLLAGTRTVAAVAGVATFSTLSINQAGTGYTLTATTTGVPVGTSAAFNITPSVATVLVFTVSPARTTAGAIITPAIQVAARDASGQLVPSFTGMVTVAISSGTSGATLSGTTAVAAVGGIASFSNLSIDKSGSTYRLTATSAGLADGTSGFFTIDPGSATQLTYTVGPSNAAAGVGITPQIEVTARDVLGNVATAFTSSVSLAITSGTGTAGAALSGVNPKAAVAGIATFPAMSINLAGTGYTLTASSGGLTVASDPFDITAGAGNHLVYEQPPSAAVAGAAITPAVVVRMLDGANALLTTFNGPVTVSITGGTGTSGAVLSGTTTVSAVNGVATFSDLSINRSGTGYRLSVVADGAAGATSGTFVITAGAAAMLDFTTQPATTTAGATMAPVTVTATDALGNRAASFTGNVTLAITTNPGGGTLSGTVTVAAVAGIATFANLSIDKSGTGYRLGVSSTGLASDASNAFSITAGTATRLIFTVQPSNAAAGANITPSVRVAALDALDNVATSFTGSVTLAIGTNPSGGVLGGTTTVAAVSGVAIFTPLSINNPGVGYALTATEASVTGATSVAFNIN